MSPETGHGAAVTPASAPPPAFDLRDALDAGRLSAWSRWPFPGEGETAQRHRLLIELGREDLSLARLGEAHTDALAILHEAGRRPLRRGLYGVWASDGPHGWLNLEPGRPSKRLNGSKQYCSGAGLADAALVTAHCGEALLLVELPLDTPGISIEPSSWRNPAMKDTLTSTVHFDHVSVGDEQIVGADRWYLERPGFWHGALGPAACWAGGALSLIDAGLASGRDDAHARAHRGALAALGWSLQTLLAQSGSEIDADKSDAGGQARIRALMVRHLVERQAAEVLDRFGRLTGPQLIAFDDHWARQHGALALYLRQCHAERDLESLANLLPPPGPRGQ